MRVWCWGAKNVRKIHNEVITVAFDTLGWSFEFYWIFSTFFTFKIIFASSNVIFYQLFLKFKFFNKNSKNFKNFLNLIYLHLYANFVDTAINLKFILKTYAMKATQLELESKTIRWKLNNDTHLHVCMQPTANKSTNELYITA